MIATNRKDKDMSKLQDEIRGHMSPQAVALTVAHLQTVYGEGPAHDEDGGDTPFRRKNRKPNKAE